MTALVHENTMHNEQRGILAVLCVSITNRGKKKKSEKLLVLQRASSISSRAGGQLSRFLNLKGETIMPKRNENFHKAIALIPSALHPSFISHCTPGEHVLKDYNINMVSKILESFS